jgi:hypothetical protein
MSVMERARAGLGQSSKVKVERARAGEEVQSARAKAGLLRRGYWGSTEARLILYAHVAVYKSATKLSWHVSLCHEAVFSSLRHHVNQDIYVNNASLTLGFHIHFRL